MTKKVVKQNVTVDVTLEVYELTREELLELRGLIFGGNGLRDNTQLMRHVADKLLGSEDIQRTLRERSSLLEKAIVMIDNMIWHSK